MTSMIARICWCQSTNWCVEWTREDRQEGRKGQRCVVFWCLLVSFFVGFGGVFFSLRGFETTKRRGVAQFRAKRPQKTSRTVTAERTAPLMRNGASIVEIEMKKKRRIVAERAVTVRLRAHVCGFRKIQYINYTNTHIILRLRVRRAAAARSRRIAAGSGCSPRFLLLRGPRNKRAWLPGLFLYS